jgi:hypothetical protein
MGERYEGNRGGGNFGREGGGPNMHQQFGGSIGNNFQRPLSLVLGNLGGISTRMARIVLEEGKGRSIA